MLEEQCRQKEETKGTNCAFRDFVDVGSIDLAEHHLLLLQFLHKATSPHKPNPTLGDSLDVCSVKATERSPVQTLIIVILTV